MKDNLKNIIVSFVFIGIIIIVLLLNIVTEDKDISLSERRNLAQFPELTLENVLNGNFTDNFENYTMDQFINREGFRNLKAIVETKVMNKKDFNGVYEYSNYLIKQEYPLNEKSILNISNKINEVRQKYLNDLNKVFLSIIPDKNYYVDDEYLKFDYAKLKAIMLNNIQNINYIDIFENLSLQDYYYTDIHWKQENLLGVLDTISTEMNFKEHLSGDFAVVDVLEFKGVYSGQYPLESKTDELKILTNEEIQNAKVYNFETKKESKVYDLDKINSNDKYDVYLSGATPLLEIENENSKSQKELVVFRDSFASSLIPLFIEGYQKITLVDLRYINLDLLETYIEFENKDILFLYSTSIINNSFSMK